MTKFKNILMVIATATILAFGVSTLIAEVNHTDTVAAATTKKKKSAKKLFKANISKHAVMSKYSFKMRGRVHWHKRVFTYYSPNGSSIYGMGRFTSYTRSNE